MKTRNFLLVVVLALALLPLTASAQVQEWTIDKNHSAAHFKVKHLLIATVRGTMTGVEGKVSFDPADWSTLKVEATIDATTIDTGNDQRDNHLRSADFFNIKKHPKITFESTKVVKVDDDEVELLGDLTMNGVTKEVTLEVEDISKAVMNPAGNYSLAATAETEVNRQDYGISWNKTMDGGGVVVGDDVKIEIDIEVLRPAEKTAKK